MQAHNENTDKVVLDTRQKLQEKINEAEAKGEMPEEAVVLVETRAIVVFGTPIEQMHAKKQWLKEQKTIMNPSVHSELMAKGKSYAVAPLPGKLRAELHSMHETLDVHMTDEARKRLAEKMRSENES